MSIYKLINQVKNYSWGGESYIQNLLGNIDFEEPAAELWMGTHHQGMSNIIRNETSIPLDEFLLESPNEYIGKSKAKKFNNKMPFLFKVLSAESPLSIQAHPDEMAASNGFLLENSEEIPLESPSRNFKDENHKPEILCALTPFTALCGFKDRKQIYKNFIKLINNVFLENLIKDKKTGLQYFFSKIISLKPGEVDSILENIKKNQHEYNQDEFKIIIYLNSFFKNDPGILAPIFLNLINLNPGEAIYIPPGILHSYIKGSGIELMANSDNVLRGGLTAKNIDKKGLVRILDYKSYKSYRADSSSNGPEKIFETKNKEFVLSEINLKTEEIYKSKPLKSMEIILCISGQGILMENSGDKININKGESFFIPACTGQYQLQGNGLFYKAWIP